MADHLYTYENPVPERDVARIVAVLNKGGIIAYPTDLNWAFGCDATQPKAIDLIKRLKPGKDLPFSLICKDIAMIAQYANVDNFAYPILRKVFPGPYTVLLERHKSLPRQLKDKRRLVGIRIPARPLLIAVVELLGKPILTTSVPLQADGSAVHFGYEVMDKFGHGLDLVCDLGQELEGQESTVFSLEDGEIQLIRAGAGSMDGLIRES